MSLFGFFRRDGDKIEWPRDDSGESVAPAFLMRLSGNQMDAELTVNLLKAYGIPVTNGKPESGGFMKTLFGIDVSGTDIYVPETMLEDAQNILSADVVETDELDESYESETDWEE
jgi:hypothetical protein